MRATQHSNFLVSHLSSIEEERERDKDKEKIATCRINRETYVLRVKASMFSAINRKKKYDGKLHFICIFLSIGWFTKNTSI